MTIHTVVQGRNSLAQVISSPDVKMSKANFMGNKSESVIKTDLRNVEVTIHHEACQSLLHNMSVSTFTVADFQTLVPLGKKRHSNFKLHLLPAI